MERSTVGSNQAARHARDAKVRLHHLPLSTAAETHSSRCCRGDGCVSDACQCSAIRVVTRELVFCASTAIVTGLSEGNIKADTHNISDAYVAWRWARSRTQLE